MDNKDKSGPAAAKPGLAHRLRAYIEATSPKFIAEIFKNGLARFAAWCLLAYVLVLFLPTLSVLAMDGVGSLLPKAAGTWLRESVVGNIHRGYGINEVSEILKKDAASDVLSKLNSNNKSLDYVQYVEFYLTKGDSPKQFPINLMLGQRMNVKVRSVQVVSAPGFTVFCERPDSGTAELVLEVSLERYSIGSVPIMSSADARGEIGLHKSWWDKHLDAVRSNSSIKEHGMVGMIHFSKLPEYEKKMNSCSALKVEATLEVFKQDIGLPT